MIEESIILEDKKEYGIIDELIIDNITYLYLCDVEKPENFCVRKVKDDKVIGLDNNEEFDKALAEFTKKWSEINS